MFDAATTRTWGGTVTWQFDPTPAGVTVERPPQPVVRAQSLIPVAWMPTVVILCSGWEPGDSLSLPVHFTLGCGLSSVQFAGPIFPVAPTNPITIPPGILGLFAADNIDARVSLVADLVVSTSVRTVTLYGAVAPIGPSQVGVAFGPR